jgi:hypothetical protein
MRREAKEMNSTDRLPAFDCYGPLQNVTGCQEINRGLGRLRRDVVESISPCEDTTVAIMLQDLVGVDQSEVKSIMKTRYVQLPQRSGHNIQT